MKRLAIELCKPPAIFYRNDRKYKYYKNYSGIRLNLKSRDVVYGPITIQNVVFLTPSKSLLAAFYLGQKGLSGTVRLENGRRILVLTGAVQSSRYYDEIKSLKKRDPQQ